MQKILLLHASAGAGHRKAAEAIERGLRRRGISPTIADALTYTSPLFRRAYVRGYERMVREHSKLWATFFDLTDTPSLRPMVRSVRRLGHALSTRSLVKRVQEGQFDTIVSTHFLSTEVVGDLRLRGAIGARLVTVVTDYDVHTIWLSKGVDFYLVAAESTRRKMLTLGVEPQRIAVTGIPVDETFVTPRDRASTRRRLGLDPDRFTLLLSTSSFGFEPIEQLAALLEDFQIIVICGHNEVLYRRMCAHWRPRHAIHRFVHNMDEMVAASDVVITKPGGLTIAEALASRVPLVFFSAIPGQEERNVRVLAEHGIGSSPGSLEGIASEIRRLSSHPDALREARNRAEALARPDSVSAIIDRLVGAPGGSLASEADLQGCML
ncbi:glycosyltransferase [Polyangium sp. y55x31]|uniref:MGDG synthase family glycosyltransferase n=1 Tax=Polyangium sp. y55x31 TaxID=3042688 RepID=UPI0024822F1A|nr:glycosyltransferase [Polyangium sp. y55x31]MDI1479366.1 glycosyltransferase [Polyangium sp. y55x31]